MSRHTPGSWEVRGSEIVAKDADYLSANTHWRIATIEPGFPHPGDARLIAAAPDLLEACKALDDFASERPQIDDPRMAPLYRIIQQARAAIARAEKES